MNAELQIEGRLKSLRSQRETLLVYSQLKLDQRDFNGCAYYCMDLRDLESEILGVEFALKQYQEMKEKN